MNLIESFVKYKGWQGSHKDGNFAIMPWLIADALKEAHDKYLKGRLKQNAKKHANSMMMCYDHLNKDFFRAFTLEEGVFITDKMNEYEDFIEEDFDRFLKSVMTPLSNYPQDVRETVAALCLCKFLAIQIDYLYSLMYRDQWGRTLPDMWITGIKYHACEMFSAFKARRTQDYIDLNQIPMVQENVNNIIIRTREFIDGFDKEK